MSKRNDDLLIEDIISSCKKILDYTKNFSEEAFKEDDKTIDADIRNFEIIGETSNKLSESFKNKEPQIDWFKMTGLRNRLIHDYMGIDLSIIWSVIQNYLPDLKLALENIKL